MLIDLKDIVTEGNVRVVGYETQIEGLVRSMKAVGQIVPITVTEYGDKYLVVAGHRRFEAAKKLEWAQIEAYVQNGTGGNSLALQIAENVSRKDLTDYELAQGVLALQTETGMNQGDIADALGVDKKVISNYQKIAKGTVGIDPVVANQLQWSGLERLGELHDMPAEMRETFADEYEAAVKRSDHQDWYLVSDYIQKVKLHRWHQKKANKALVAAMENIGAIPMEREERDKGKRLYGDQVMMHQGQPCHGYMIVTNWDSNDFIIEEYCLDPGSHADSAVNELKEVAAQAKAQGKVSSTVAQRAADKARRERKTRKKELVKAFAEKPRMKDLTRAMIAVILYEFRQYKWSELGKTFGMEKSSDRYHFEWQEYLEKFNQKDQVTQSLILGIGSLYISFNNPGYGGSELDALTKVLDEVFGYEPDEEELAEEQRRAEQRGRWAKDDAGEEE